ncbi:MAG: hypothetical protein FWG77_09125 [Treponema sp.]|nr:hypothetical protein [Treponema sp.]
MAENDDYVKELSDALKARGDWLEKTELPKLKDELRLYHTGFTSLYNIYVKKGLINIDPYKQEAKIGELEVPKSSTFTEAEKLDQLTQRLANYDNQLDFLVNFYQYSTEFLTLDRIKRIVGLVRYIDWVHFSLDSQSPMTQAAAEMTNQVKIGSDALTMSVITESLSNLAKTCAPIMAHLKALSDYLSEAYKLDLREATTGMSQTEMANINVLRKKMSQAKPGVPFYGDLLEEVMKEDYSKDGPSLRAEVLKKLQIADNKPKAAKAEVSFKNILIDGISSLGSTASSFSDILVKIDENQAVLENRKKGFFEKLVNLIRQMMNKEPDPVVYDLEYMDPVKAVSVKERVFFNTFRSDLERKIRTLTPMATRTPSTTAKLEAMPEEQLVGFLERNVRELQSLHKVLSAMDEFFKAEVDKEDRDRIKGIKPELSTIKNSVLKANAKRHEYNAQKEEEEQLRRLGVKPSES